MQTETETTTKPKMHGGEKVQRQFVDDMEELGVDTLRIYCGRFYYYGFAVEVDRDSEFDEQDIIRATKVHLKRDSMGLGMVLYPSRGFRDEDHMREVADELGIEQ